MLRILTNLYCVTAKENMGQKVRQNLKENGSFSFVFVYLKALSFLVIYQSLFFIFNFENLHQFCHGSAHKAASFSMRALTPLIMS